MPAKIEVAGREYGEWTVLRRADRAGRQAYWVCRCRCGKEAEVSGSNLRTGQSTRCKSCRSAAVVMTAAGRAKMSARGQSPDAIRRLADMRATRVARARAKWDQRDAEIEAAIRRGEGYAAIGAAHGIGVTEVGRVAKRRGCRARADGAAPVPAVVPREVAAGKRGPKPASRPSERDAGIVARLAEGHTQVEVAAEFGLTKQRVQQIYRRWAMDCD